VREKISSLIYLIFHFIILRFDQSKQSKKHMHLLLGTARTCCVRLSLLSRFLVFVRPFVPICSFRTPPRKVLVHAHSLLPESNMYVSKGWNERRRKKSGMKEEGKRVKWLKKNFFCFETPFRIFYFNLIFPLNGTLLYKHKYQNKQLEINK
jgi:hypothetical protein